MSKNKNRFEKISTGIKKDTGSGTYYIEKSIRGERYYTTKDDLESAKDWYKNFHPSLSLGSIKDSKVKERAKKKILELEEKHTSNGIRKINGNDFGYTFSDVWELYKENYLPTIEESSQMRRLNDAKFYTELMDVKMVDMNEDLITAHLKIKVEQALNNPKSRRFNCDNDLKNLKAVFNWYRERYDSQFCNPILKRHKVDGFIKKVPKKKKKLKSHELLAFFEALEKESLFWRDFAETQFYLASRVQEPAGLLRSCVDLVDGTLEIENVAVWGNDKKFCYLKETPKNNEDREVKINKKLAEILKRRLSDNPIKPWHICPKTGVTLALVFHINGRPLTYREVQYSYNKALRKSGLHNKYSSTHIMRHTMANMVRSQVDLDSAQAVGGWKTRELVENVYTETPTHLGGNAREVIEDFLSKESPRTGGDSPDRARANKTLALVR